MSMLSPGSRLGNYPYQVVKVLNETPGNMSEVCIASVRNRGETEDSLVVIKLAAGPEVKHAEFHRQALLNEARRLKVLKHPGIVRIFPIQFENERPTLQYDASANGLAGKPWFIVTELLSGGSLTKLIKENAIDIPMALEIARSLAATLDYLHSRSQVHLDLKPDNVLFRAPPVAGQPVESVLIDFGIARDFGQEGLQAKTAQYASPERVYELRNPRQPPERLARPHPSMDIYALGVMLYEMLTGVLPFDGITESKLLSAIITGNPRPPANINQKIVSALDAYILKMMAKEPSERPTASDVAINLEEIAIRFGYMSRYPQGTDVVKGSTSPSKPIWKNWWFWLLIGLVLLELLFILATRPYWNGKISAPALAQNLNPFAVGVAKGDVEETATPTLAIPATPVEEATLASSTGVALGPTSTLVATLAAVEEPSPETPPPQSIATSTPRPTDTAAAMPQIATETVMQTVIIDTVMPIPTSTSLPSASTNRLTPTTHEVTIVTSTPIPPTATKIVTVTPTAVAKQIQPSKPASAVKVNIVAKQPGNDERLKGRIQTIFSWETSGELASNQCFELFRWEDGQDRDVTGLGMKAASKSATVALRLDDVRPNLKGNIKYYWGVRVISCPNITAGRMKPVYVGGGRSFWYEPGADGNSNSNQSGKPPDINPNAGDP